LGGLRSAKECSNNGARLEQLRHGGEHCRVRCERAVKIGPGGWNAQARPVRQDHNELELALMRDGAKDLE
jgi:hypothetical protein